MLAIFANPFFFAPRSSVSCSSNVLCYSLEIFFAFFSLFHPIMLVIPAFSVFAEPRSSVFSSSNVLYSSPELFFAFHRAMSSDCDRYFRLFFVRRAAQFFMLFFYSFLFFSQGLLGV
jgi:hypothetical protein